MASVCGPLVPWVSSTYANHASAACQGERTSGTRQKDLLGEHAAQKTNLACPAQPANQLSREPVYKSEERVRGGEVGERKCRMTHSDGRDRKRRRPTTLGGSSSDKRWLGRSLGNDSPFRLISVVSGGTYSHLHEG